MTAQQRLERTLKDLDVLARLFRAAALGAESLEDKLSMLAGERNTNNARSTLRKLYYEVENAEVHAANTRTCGWCNCTVTGMAP